MCREALSSYKDCILGLFLFSFSHGLLGRQCRFHLIVKKNLSIQYIFSMILELHGM